MSIYSNVDIMNICTSSMKIPNRQLLNIQWVNFDIDYILINSHIFQTYIVPLGNKSLKWDSDVNEL